MKKSRVKFLGVCAVALMSVSAVSPSAAILFGEASSAEATVINANYLVDSVSYEQGTFTQADLDALLQVDKNITAEAITGNTLGALGSKLFPGANPGYTPGEALGIRPIGSPTVDYTVWYSTDLPAGTTLFDLNKRTEPINVKFEIGDKDGKKTGEVFTSVINIASYDVAAENLTKNLEDDYKVKEGVTVTDLAGKKLADGDYTVKDISTPKLFDDSNLGYVNASTKYAKLVDGFEQRLLVSYKNDAGVTVEKIVTRTITVTETAETTPVLWLSSNNPIGGAGGAIYYTNGQTVGMQYAHRVEALNQAPAGGTVAYFAANRELNKTTGHFLVDSVENPSSLSDSNVLPANNIWLVAKDGTAASYFNNSTDVEVNADDVDLTVAGTYYYTVTVKNAAGVTATFKLPLIVTPVANAPWYTYAPGYGQEMTIEVGTPFNPLEGIHFYENQSVSAAEITETARLQYESNVNTSVEGTYTVKYTVTNKIGKTTTVTRTVKVVKPGTIEKVAVYRAYNPNDGDHLYTTSKAEYDQVVAAGWLPEGVAFQAASEGTPVYRLWNPNSGEHFYTTSLTEYNEVAAAGWAKEGIAFYSTTSDGVAVYRAFNPNATGPGSHFFTASASEYNGLTGWTKEGVAFYALGE